ncbi:MAG TPA: hypothetical protein VNO50_19785 [Pyrinomonadaceae bacterium]|nr:hypothetical protein [Pyrinomonadaceae bacterium]
MAETRKVKVTAKDIESVSEKLNTFAKQLPPGEQNVMAWLLSRAAEAPAQPEAEKVLAPQEAKGKALATPGAAKPASLSTVQLSRSLGIAQFAGARRPGSLAAGSSIGVTGTIMF